MKIELYVKNRDMEKVEEHLKKFLAKHLKGKNKIELKKISKIDKIHQALSNKDYKRIVKFYIEDNLLDSALTHIAELIIDDIELRIVFKYGSYGNLILIDNEIIDFVKQEEKKGREAVNKLYQGNS